MTNSTSIKRAGRKNKREKRLLLTVEQFMLSLCCFVTRSLAKPAESAPTAPTIGVHAWRRPCLSLPSNDI
jgi:hypothetical protein